MLLDYLYLPALLIIGALSLAAILDHAFDDNLVQRIGLAMTCFGSVIRLYTLLNGTGDLAGPRLVLINGIAVFAIGTAYRFWCRNHYRGIYKCRRKNPRIEK